MIGDGAKKFDVLINDQVTPPFHYYFMREDKADITLTAPAVLGSDIINVSAGHGFTAGGEFISIFDNNRYMQCKVKAVNTNAVTLDFPVTHAFSINAVVVRGSVDMNIDGSVTPQLFMLRIRESVVPFDIDTFITSMVHAAEGDDSKFGGIAAITNGVHVRKENAMVQNLGNYKKNSDYKSFGSSVEYTSKAGGGAYGTLIKSDLREIYGVVVRVRPAVDEIVKVIIRDNLTGLTSMRVSALGQFTQGEL